MNKPIHHDNSDNNVTGTNLLLALLLLKTKDDKTNLPDNPALLSIVQSLSKSSELYFSGSTPLQWNPNVNAQSRAVSDSSTSSTCCDSSLSLPSSVHVADVTHGTCVAHEHPASHGVSATANETNVNCGIICGDTEGMSCSVSVPSGFSRMRPASSRSKRYNQGSSKPITFIVGLTKYWKKE
jgi:hypothetical protein